jgi:transposase InsO family protein
LDLWAYFNGVKLDFSRPGKPTDNAFIESFNGRLRVEGSVNTPPDSLSGSGAVSGGQAQSEQLPASRGCPAVARSRILDHEPKPAVGDEIPHA